MAELDLDALKQAAREAGGGCWFSAGWTVGSRGFEVGDLKSRDRVCSDVTERCAEFIAAANPATINELLDRLEAAEKLNAEWLKANAPGGWIDELRADKATLQQMTYSLKDRLEVAESEALEEARLNGMGSEREAALMAKLEAVEKERNATMRLADSLALALNTSNHERDALRAKVERMEKQAPVASIYIDGKGDREFDDWKCDLPVGRSLLYALPGAKGE